MASFVKFLTITLLVQCLVYPVFSRNQDSGGKGDLSENLGSNEDPESKGLWGSDSIDTNHESVDHPHKATFTQDTSILTQFLTEGLKFFQNFASVFKNMQFSNPNKTKDTEDKSDSIKCGGTYLIPKTGSLKFKLKSPDKECKLTFVGSRLELCRAVIKCNGKVKDVGRSISCGDHKDFFEIYDATNGKDTLCGSSDFDNIPRRARNDGWDLFVKYKASSDSAICTVGCAETYATDDVHQLAINNEYKRNIDDSCVCGKRNSSDAVMNGDNAQPFEFPWIAPIVPYIQYGRRRTPFCSASLINDRYALTAAHCMFNAKNRGFTVNDIELVFHSHRMAKEGVVIQDNQDSPEVKDNAENSVRKQVDEIILHPKYHHYENKLDYDIALIKLKGKVYPKRDNVIPICLPEVDDEFNHFTGKVMTVAGWGRFNHKVESHVRTLQKLEVQTARCPFNQGSRRHFCTGSVKGGKGTCIGDSGGPLIAPMEGTVENQYVLGGVVSSVNGNDCSTQGYINVQELVEWVYHNTQDGVFCSKIESKKRPKSQRKQQQPQQSEEWLIRGRNLNQEDVSSGEDSERLPVPPEVLTFNKALDDIDCNGTYSMTEKGFMTFKLEATQQSCKYIFEGSIGRCTVALLCKGKLNDNGSSTSCNNENDYFEISDGNDGKELLCGSSDFDQIPKVPQDNGTDLFVVYKASSNSTLCSVFCVEDVKHDDETMSKLMPLPKNSEVKTDLLELAEQKSELAEQQWRRYV